MPQSEDISNFGDLIPLIPYAETIGADPRLLRRQASRCDALVDRGGVDFIDRPRFDECQRVEAENRRKAKARRRAQAKESTGSIETTRSIGLLRALYRKLQLSVPRKERELSEFSSRVDSESDPLEKRSLSQKRDKKKRSLDKSRETFARVERRLTELAGEEPEGTTA
jgi:hypothetical protein